MKRKQKKSDKLYKLDLQYKRIREREQQKTAETIERKYNRRRSKIIKHCDTKLQQELMNLKRKDKWSKEHQYKKKEITIAGLKRKLKWRIQKFVRLFAAKEWVRKWYVHCISCAWYWLFSDCDGWHYFPSNNSRLVFDLRNINPQCRKCNRMKHGNQIHYREWLVKIHGEERVNELEEDGLKQWVVIYKREWLIKEIERYKQQNKEMEAFLALNIQDGPQRDT